MNISFWKSVSCLSQCPLIFPSTYSCCSPGLGAGGSASYMSDFSGLAFTCNNHVTLSFMSAGYFGWYTVDMCRFHISEKNYFFYQSKKRGRFKIGHRNLHFLLYMVGKKTTWRILWWNSILLPVRICLNQIYQLLGDSRCQNNITILKDHFIQGVFALNMVLENAKLGSVKAGCLWQPWHVTFCICTTVSSQYWYILKLLNRIY